MLLNNLFINTGVGNYHSQTMISNGQFALVSLKFTIPIGTQSYTEGSINLKEYFNISRVIRIVSFTPDAKYKGGECFVGEGSASTPNSISGTRVFFYYKDNPNTFWVALQAVVEL